MGLNRGWFYLFAAALLAGLAYAAWSLTRPAAPAPLQAAVQVSSVLKEGADAGFARALEPRTFAFPLDHGPHPAFRSEWWYYTGNLTSADGRQFGFQLTFFRTALRSPLAALATQALQGGASPWHANEVYMAHFAITDVGGGQFHAYDKFARAAVGLAGAELNPFHVWLENWSATAAAPPPSAVPDVASTPAPALFPMRLRADQDDMGLDLTLTSAKPVVLQGDRGLSRKGAEPGQASYYYSLTRMATTGSLRIGEATFSVTGLSWMDREWSTSALSKDQVGWDWFSLQLADGRELMYYQLRRADGSADPVSSGTVIAVDGSVTPFGAGDIHVEPRGQWTSPHSGAMYPAGWHLAVPSQAIDVIVTPRLADQELNLYVRYWEGAVRVDPADGKAAVGGGIGSGYVELTGYEPPAAPAGR